MVRKTPSARTRWSMNTASRKPRTRQPAMNSTPKMTMFSTEIRKRSLANRRAVLREADAVERRQQLRAGEGQPHRPQHAAEIDDDHDEGRRQQRQRRPASAHPAPGSCGGADSWEAGSRWSPSRCLVRMADRADGGSPPAQDEPRSSARVAHGVDELLDELVDRHARRVPVLGDHVLHARRTVRAWSGSSSLRHLARRIAAARHALLGAGVHARDVDVEADRDRALLLVELDLGLGASISSASLSCAAGCACPS